MPVMPAVAKIFVLRLGAAGGFKRPQGKPRTWLMESMDDSSWGRNLGVVEGTGGSQANDAEQPHFNGMYKCGLPSLQKECCAYRRTYCARVRNELVAFTLKENCLASSVKYIVGDIEEDLYEVRDTLDTCCDWSEKHSCGPWTGH
jgi:hypothetical protein